MKKLFSIILLLAFLASTILIVNAHQGRTDGNGGHTDHSTGEYHYHHGYSAHDHYDMDGDGDLDCPYEFDDKTNLNSGTNIGKNSESNSGKSNNVDNLPSPNTQDQSNSQKHTTMQSKGEDNIYSYITLGFVIVFFIIINGLAIHMDRTDTSVNDEPISLPSVFISAYSTLIVFAVLFCIMYLFKQPITWRAISFKEMFQVLFFSAIFGGLVWLVTNWASILVNTFLCKLFKIEVHGWAGSFQRLTIPLSYAFTVLLFIIQ